MSIFLTVAWFISGAIVGAVVCRWLSLKQFNQHKLQLELDESRQQLQKYRTEVSSHLETTHRLMGQLQDNYEQITQHMSNTRMQLVEPNNFVENSGLNYLSTDAAAHIRSSIGKIDERRRKHASPQAQQPLDYAGHSTGIMKSFGTEKKSES